VAARGSRSHHRHNADIGIIVVGVQGAEFEDGFGGADAQTGAGDVHSVFYLWRQVPSMTPLEMGQPAMKT
jgi:hypothetical protein